MRWTKHSTLETNFRVERPPTNGSMWSTIGYVPNGRSIYIDSTIAPDTTYFYRVSAISGASETSDSNVAMITTQPGLPSVPPPRMLPPVALGDIGLTLDGLSAGDALEVVLGAMRNAKCEWREFIRLGITQCGLWRARSRIGSLAIGSQRLHRRSPPSRRSHRSARLAAPSSCSRRRRACSRSSRDGPVDTRGRSAEQRVLRPIVEAHVDQRRGPDVLIVDRVHLRSRAKLNDVGHLAGQFQRDPFRLGSRDSKSPCASGLSISSF